MRVRFSYNNKFVRLAFSSFRSCQAATLIELCVELLCISSHVTVKNICLAALLDMFFVTVHIYVSN